MFVTVRLSWALLVDAPRWNFLVDKPPHHDKVSFMEGVMNREWQQLVEIWRDLVTATLQGGKYSNDVLEQDS